MATSSGDAGNGIRTRLERWLAEPLPDFEDRTLPREHKWRASSALQKSIRRGNLSTALTMASALMKLEPRYLIRRLPVIALEDAGLGNLDAVEATIWALSDAKWRREHGTEAIVLKLVERLCTGIKDRSTCDLVVAAGFDPLRAPERGWAADATAPELMQAMVSGPDPVARCISAWQLAGPERHRTGELRKGKAQPDFEAVVEATAPDERVATIMRAAWRKGCDVLPIGLGITAGISAGATAWERDVLPEQLDPIDGYPTESFDQHTREGRRALAYFAEVAPTFADLLRRGGVAKNRLGAAAGELLFQVEGDAVDRRLTFPGSREIRAAATGAFLRWAGLRDEFHAPALELLRLNLHLLQHARQRVLDLTPPGGCPHEVAPRASRS